jgi:predicted PurR-regulated permease PerM
LCSRAASRRFLAKPLTLKWCSCPRFTFFRDGKHIVDWAHENLPVTPERRQLVLKRFDEVVKGAVYGNTVVALLEGFIGELAFWLVGLPSPIL